uniref:isopentenyl-diphosphate Delta-isomerase n=1 Tax=Lygus hesperus TaxID=30085 RepID=A0A0A9Y2Z6_LYGHE
MGVLRTVLSRGVRFYSRLAINPVQEASLNETCILVDANDKVVGKASKEQCHLVGPNGEIPLHRAFSVFIFNSQHDLLLQKRSSTKITFPNHVTNSCCSHPLHDWEDERVEEDAIGIKQAARRRLQYELGIPKSLIDPKDIVYLTRVHYKDTGDGVWGEHEVDYILFIIGKDLPLRPNPEEVSHISYLRRSDFDSYLANLVDPVTPWFSLIAKSYLTTWWDNLSRISQYQDHKSITNFTKSTP